MLVGCSYTNGTRHFDIGYRYDNYYPGQRTGHFVHQYRTEQMQRQLRLQRMEMEEIRMQQQIIFNNELIQRERLRIE